MSEDGILKKTLSFVAALLFGGLAPAAHAQTYTTLYWGIDRTTTPNKIGVRSADLTQWFDVLTVTAGGSPLPMFASSFCAANEWITASSGVPLCAGIANNAVTNAMLAQMAQGFSGRAAAGTGNREDLTPTQATALLSPCVGDSGSGGTKGLVPAPGAGDAAAGKVLKADCTWTTSAAGGANVDTMAALRALTAGQYSSIWLTGFYSLGDGGEGLFVWDGASSATDDNGTVIAPDVGSGRWLRVVNSTQPHVVWWGARCNAYTYRPTVTISSGAAALTVDAGSFSAADIGKKITVQGAGAAGAALATTISAVTDTTHITLGANASTTVSAVLNFVQYGDDDATPFNAAEAWAGARGGAKILVPGWCGVGATISMSHSGVHFEGLAGNHGQHDIGQQSLGPGLVAVDAGITMLTASPVAGASNQRIDGVGIKNLAFHGGGAASVGAKLSSLKFSDFMNLSFFEFTSGALDLNTVTSLGEVASNCQNSYENISLVNQRVGGYGLRLTGQTASTSNTCLSKFSNLMVIQNNGDGIQCVYADNNEFIRTFIFHVSGGTGHALNLTGLDGTHYCQGNHWYGLTIGNKDGSGGNLHSFANAQGNTIANYDSYNASPTPVEDAGTSLFWYYEIHAPNGH